VRISNQVMVICRLTGTVPAIRDLHSRRRAVTACTVEDVLPLLGLSPLTGEGAMLTCRSVTSVHTVAAHASALLQQTIITLCSRARRCDVK
jgi:hypothetical protein